MQFGLTTRRDRPKILTTIGKLILPVKLFARDLTENQDPCKLFKRIARFEADFKSKDAGDEYPKQYPKLRVPRTAMDVAKSDRLPLLLLGMRRIRSECDDVVLSSSSVSIRNRDDYHIFCSMFELITGDIHLLG